MDFASISYPNAATVMTKGYNPSVNCFIRGRKCPPLDGTSLAPIVLGKNWKSLTFNNTINQNDIIQLPGYFFNLIELNFLIYLYCLFLSRK